MDTEEWTNIKAKRLGQVTGRWVGSTSELVPGEGPHTLRPQGDKAGPGGSVILGPPGATPLPPAWCRVQPSLPQLPAPLGPQSLSPQSLRYIVHLGEHNLQRPDGCEQTRVATESFPHPGFNNSLPNKDHRNDIMLVKMSVSAVVTRAVRPLALSSRCVTPGTRCLISGWGTTSSPQLNLPHTLRCANISIIGQKECENAYPGNITDTMVCASVKEEGKDSCQGDSGGPLVCNGSLQGIISWGQDPCAVTKKPGVYTKVCKYVGWIRKTMENN
ncbi:kallikrein-11 isoform X2 [Manis javanica]|uniref:kallikrein-11 isoform X2 n=1 Tax=Manis javanica TaxID=9974 RepID=UPI00187A8F44|nr:kallikrein-11 isoform X2 [Manis javanica]